MRIPLNTEDNHTTARFKRSLSEAFPYDASNAAAFELPKQKDHMWLLWVVLLLCLIGVLVITQNYRNNIANNPCPQESTAVHINAENVVCMKDNP